MSGTTPSVASLILRVSGYFNPPFAGFQLTKRNWCVIVPSPIPGSSALTCRMLHSLIIVNSLSENPAPDPPRVLVIEDEVKTRNSLVEGLRIESWEIETAATARDAWSALQGKPFDLVILDWMLSDQNGVNWLREARAREMRTPVLMLTARDSLSDRVEGLETGADDYLVKPFAFAELIARCRALLRRPQWATQRLLRCSDLQLDPRARVATRAGREIPLTPREVDVLEYMLRNQGHVVTREMLERDVWKQVHRLTTLDNVIDVQMTRLRRKVDLEGAERLIHTLRGVGYQIGGKVQ
jgi:DNA-binding response OmpR family regulator